MSLDEDKDRVNEKAKYEFMQELSIIPTEREQKLKLDSETKKGKVSKNEK